MLEFLKMVKNERANEHHITILSTEKLTRTLVSDELIPEILSRTPVKDLTRFRIVQMDQMPLGETLSRVEIYSVNQDSWKPTGRLVPFHPGSPSCTFIVKGVPSWVDAGSENLGATDPCIEKYRMVPAMTLMDSVVLVLYSPGMDRNHWIDVYVLDESCGYWIKKHTTQPIVAA